MKKGFLAATIISLSCSSALLAHEHHECGQTPLHGYMVDIKTEMRAMSSAVKEGDNETASNHVESIIQYFEKSRNEMPYLFKEQGLKGSQLANNTSQYQKIIDDTIHVLKNLDMALSSGNSSDVGKWLGALGNQRNQGHGSFKSNC
ncbi:cytochrome b562 [Marinomonas sp. IMCC 4694]|uniref:cytochrome b562 n=1 Tax=Marinomonas sp. IMCC 4694 TaxID=2605432 RepID=UPI0011E8856B|nr:cytochrome b562 [Marinomonas sp. IMCC 4694]TYL47889.1 hypothetical protein FXV75_07980 [Marinomonas sp. IMCC 4694]